MANGRVLVTGASGFVGLNTLPALWGRGFEVHGAARHPPRGAAGDVAWHRADLLAPGAAAELIEAIKPTHLLHLAWYAEPGKYWTAPVNRDWVTTSADLAQAFFASGGRRIVGAGTCAEYQWGESPLAEARSAIRPATPYGRAKADLAARLARVARHAGRSVAWARLFFLFGRHEQEGRLVSSIARGALAGEEVPLTSGEQARDFLYAADAGDALAAILASEVEGPINVGSGEATLVRELATAVAGAAGRPDVLRFGAIERPDDDPDAIVADVTRLRTEVGWEAPTEHDQAVAETVEWWRASEDRR